MACRDKMHDAQCLAGMAFSNALLGIVHSMAHKTGAAFTGGHIIHGCANAMYLPKVIKYNSKDPVAAERYAKIAKFINLKGETTEELVDALRTTVRAALRLTRALSTKKNSSKSSPKLPRTQLPMLAQVLTHASQIRKKWKNFSRLATTIQKLTSDSFDKSICTYHSSPFSGSCFLLQND